MSAKQLCDALAAAGFDSGDPLDPESLDWAFLQGDDSSRVLAWIAARLRRANVLSASDLDLSIPLCPAKPLEISLIGACTGAR
jgi:HAUS augmin-like complex subunit 3